VASFCEHGNEPAGTIKKSKLFFGELRNYRLFKEYPVPCSFVCVCTHTMRNCH